MDFNNKEEIFDFIEKLCSLDLSEFEIKTGNEKEEELLFKLAYLFIKNNNIINFEDSVDGLFNFLNWVFNQLYTKNDPLYVICEIFRKNNENQEFISLYEEFYNLMGGRDMDKPGKYENLYNNLCLKYNAYKNGYVKM